MSTGRVLGVSLFVLTYISLGVNTILSFFLKSGSDMICLIQVLINRGFFLSRWLPKLKTLTMNQYYFWIPLLLILFLCPDFPRAQEPETLTLEQAVQLAVNNNPEIEFSQADIDISKAIIKQAKSAYYPQISSRLIVPFIGRESGFYLDQLIWDFGRTSNRVKSSKAALDSSRFKKDSTRDDLILDTIIAYYTVLSDKHVSASLEKRVREAQKRLERATSFFESERASGLDVTKAQVHLSDVELELTHANNNLELSNFRLKTLMGAGDELDFNLEDVTGYKKTVFDLEESIDRALRSRPELMELGAREVSTRANHEIAKKEFYPIIFGRTAYRFEGEGAQTPGFIAGVGLKFPIFEGFSRFGKLEEAKAGIRKVKSEIEIAKANVVSEVKESYLELEFAEENILVRHKTKESAQKTLMLAEERYRQGRASEVELAEAEALFETAKAKYMQALYTYIINVARLERATGGIYEFQQ